MQTTEASWWEKGIVTNLLDRSDTDVERLVQRGKLKTKVVNGTKLYNTDDVLQLCEEGEDCHINAVFSTGEDLDRSIESIEFINEPWLPKGLVTLLIASPGLGKSKLALDVTSRILNPATGWFDGKALKWPTMSKVLWLETEAFQAGLKDRINALGIPKDRVIFPFKNPLEDVRLDDDDHRAQIENVIREVKPSLVVVDSLRGSHGKDENDSRDMTKILLFLARLARDYNIAVLVIHHVRKPTAGEPDIIDLNRQRGSSATAYLARTVWALDRPNPASDLLRLRVIKSNVARFPEPLGLKPTNRGIEWLGKVPEAPRRKTQKEEAIDFLQEALKTGPRPSDELEEEAGQKGIAKMTLRRASESMGVIKKPGKKKGGPWDWKLLPRGLKRGASLKPSDSLSDDAD